MLQGDMADDRHLCLCGASPDLYYHQVRIPQERQKVWQEGARLSVKERRRVCICESERVCAEMRLRILVVSLQQLCCCSHTTRQTLCLKTLMDDLPAGCQAIAASDMLCLVAQHQGASRAKPQPGRRIVCSVFHCISISVIAVRGLAKGHHQHRKRPQSSWVAT